MNKKRLASMLTVALGVALGASFMIAGTDSKKEGAADKPTEVKKDTDPWSFLPDVLATYGKSKLTKQDFIDSLLPMMQLPKGASVPAEYIPKIKEDLPKIVDGIISQKIVVEMAEKDGFKASPERVIAEFEKTFNAAPEEKKKQIEMMIKLKENMTLDQYKQKISNDKMAQQGLAVSEWVDKKIVDKVNISDEQLKDFYDKNKKSFEKPETVAASHILIKPKDETDAAKAEAKKKAEGLLERLTKGGEDFGKLAKAESACPSSQKLGDLGEFGRGQMVKEFEDAAFSLEPNKLSNVVETKFGFHIIKVTGKTKASVVPFEEAKPFIKEQLTGPEVQKTIKEMIDAEKKRLNVKINV